MGGVAWGCWRCPNREIWSVGVLLFVGIGRTFSEDCGEAGEAMDKNRDTDFVERERHVGSLSGLEWLVVVKRREDVKVKAFYHIIIRTFAGR